MQIQHQVDLKPYNTFGIHVLAADFILLQSTAQLAELSAYPHRHIMGGGSNILYQNDPVGLVIVNQIKGIHIIEEDESSVVVQVASGEIWHEFVLYSLAQGWNGLENLALIPGTVGAAPIQNIGAYGVELKDFVASVNYWDWESQCYKSLNKEECHFGYRDSIFKNDLKGQFFISSVQFRLSKKQQLNTSYGAIEEELQKHNILHPTAMDVAQAVIHIRSGKLPNPKEIGNAGSFFKNPSIPIQQFLELKKEYHNIPSYPINEQLIKVPAAWLIEQCGWKGFRKDDYGVHAQQALVLVNYGQANGKDIWDLSTEIVHSVEQSFGIELEREVQVW